MWQFVFTNIGRIVSFAFNSFTSILGPAGLALFLGFFAIAVSARFLLGPILGFSTAGVPSRHTEKKQTTRSRGDRKK